MKATLAIGACRITADLSTNRLNTVLETFISQIDDLICVSPNNGGAAPDESVISGDEAVELIDMEAAAASLNPQPAPKRLYHFQCPSCSRAPVISAPEIKPGDTVDCHCGKAIRVFHIREASGACPECGQSFWRIGMINRLDVITCKKCNSPITLVDAGNGQLGPEGQ